jgi:hypothetical protein
MDFEVGLARGVGRVFPNWFHAEKPAFAGPEADKAAGKAKGAENGQCRRNGSGKWPQKGIARLSRNQSPQAFPRMTQIDADR